MKLSLGLLATATVLSLNIAPAMAGGGNDGVVQSQSQTSIITGDGNATYQRSIQKSTNVRRGRAGGDSAVIQTSDQVCDTFGSYNACLQESGQQNRNVRGRSRR